MQPCKEQARSVSNRLHTESIYYQPLNTTCLCRLHSPLLLRPQTFEKVTVRSPQSSGVLKNILPNSNVSTQCSYYRRAYRRIHRHEPNLPVRMCVCVCVHACAYDKRKTNKKTHVQRTEKNGAKKDSKNTHTL